MPSLTYVFNGCSGTSREQVTITTDITFTQIVECEALKTVAKRDFNNYHKGIPEEAKLVYTLVHDALLSGRAPRLCP